MRPHKLVALGMLVTCSLFAARSARGQVKEIVIGLTPSCPYGRCGCWSAAPEALRRLDIGEVSEYPDTYNWTVSITPKSGDLPDVEHIKNTFKSLVNETVAFRGVEVTIIAEVALEGDSLLLRSPDFKQRVALASLEHKLQWNINKHRDRQPEPDEKSAYDDLNTALKNSPNEPLRASVTGPLLSDHDGYRLEVREFWVFRSEASLQTPLKEELQ